MRGFQNGLIFKIWPSGSGDIWILVIQETWLFYTRLRGNLHTRSGTKQKIFEGFFCNFLGINIHNFAKNDPKFENKSLFDAKFYEAWHEKFLRSQSSDIWSLGPKS